MTGSLTSLPGRLLMHSQLWLPWQVFASHVDKSRCVKLHGSSLLQTKMANHGYAKIWEMHGNANLFFFFWKSMNIIPDHTLYWVVVMSWSYHASNMVSWVRELFSFHGWGSEQCSNHSLGGSPALGNLLISPLSHVVVQFASLDAPFWGFQWIYLYIAN